MADMRRVPIEVAIPVVEGQLTVHFVHCKEFALIEVQDHETKSKHLLAPPLETLVISCLDNTLETGDNVCDH